MYKMAALPSEGANMSLMWLFVWKYIFWKAFKKGLATLKGLSNQTYQNSKYFPTNTRRMPYTRSYSSRNESSRFEIEEKTKSMWLKKFLLVLRLFIKNVPYFENCYNSWLRVKRIRWFKKYFLWWTECRGNKVILNKIRGNGEALVTFWIRFIIKIKHDFPLY